MQPTQKAPDDRSLRNLLNAAFDGWGDEAYFRWKYTDFPRYDPADHNVVVERDGEVVAARRIFAKPLRVGGDERIVHVHGGTAVDEAYRQRGLYTRLVERSRAYSEAEGSPILVTFNREGKITTEAHKRRGWEYRTLPAYILPRSPDALIERHASQVVGDLPAVTAGARAVASRLTDRGVALSIELATGGVESPLDVAKTLWSILGEVRLAGRDSSPSPRVRSDAATTVEPYVPSDLGDVVGLFEEELRQYEAAFARGEAEIRHMAEYPRGESLVARTDGEVTGFASVGFVDRGPLLEARVLDVVASDDAAEAALLAAVERVAARSDADVVSLFSRSRPDGRWARLRTEYVMWDWLTDDRRWREALSGDNRWRITAYDVL